MPFNLLREIFRPRKVKTYRHKPRLSPLGRAVEQLELRDVPAVLPVTIGNLNGWSALPTDSSVGDRFISGPATPPLTAGSLELTIGADGDQAARFQNFDYNGDDLSSLTALSYSTYTSQWVDSQSPYLVLRIDFDGDGSTDDRLFFEPVYQDATYFPSNPQATLALNTWQTWNALAGGWWSENGYASAGGGTDVKSLATIFADYAVQPGYDAVRFATDASALRVQTGGGAGSWDNFIGNVDNLTIGFSGANTTFDFGAPVSTVYVDDDWAGTTIGADPDGAGPAKSFGLDSFATVQGGVTGVATGGTVNVAAGIYLGSVTISQTLTLRGTTSDPAAVVIDPPGAGITVAADDVSISNVTVTAFDDGIVAANVNNLTLTNVHLTANADDGLVLTNIGGTVTLTNVVIDQNGGDGIDATAASGAVLTLSNVTIDNNTGAGLKADGFGTLNFTSLTVTNNGSGGGINGTLTPSTTLNYLATTGSTPYSVTAGSTSLQFTADPSGTPVPSQSIAMASLGAMNLTGGTGSDYFLVTPAVGVVITVNGNLPDPMTTPGDVLDLDLVGTTGGAVTRASTPTGYTGSYTFTNRANVNFSRIESLVDLVNPATITGTVAGQTTTDKVTIKPFANVTVSTTDSIPVTLTITQSDIANGAFSAASLTASGFTDLGGGVYQQTALAATITTGIRQLVFVPTQNQVSPPNSVTTTFTLEADNGVLPITVDNTTTVIATAANDATTITGTVSGQSINDKQTILPFQTVTLSDADPNQILTIDITLSAAINGKFSDASLAASGFGLNTGYVYYIYLSNPPQYFHPYRFIGTAAEATTAIRMLEFVPTENQVSPSSTVLTSFKIVANDGYAVTTNQATTVNVQSVNDAPTITGTVAGQTTDETVAIKPFTNVSFADADSPAQTQTVLVTLSNAANGTLSGGGFTSLGGGVYRYTGNSGFATTAIRQLTFTPTKKQVAPGDTVTTTFTISISDNVAPAVTDNTTTVIVTALNSAPTITGYKTTIQAVTDKATVKPFSTVTIADTDTPAQTLTVQVILSDAANGVLTGAFTNMGGGVYEFSGTAAAATTAIRALTFVPTANQITPNTKVNTTFTISADDGFTVASNASTIVQTSSTNDAPTITGAVANQAVTDKTTVLPFTGVTIGDVDAPSQIQTVTITLSSSLYGTFSGASLVASGFSATGIVGKYVYSGTAADATNAIRLLEFVPTQNLVTPGANTQTKFTIVVSDGITSVTNAVTTVNSQSVNDAAEILGLQATYTTGSSPVTNLFAGVTFNDVDKPQQNLTLIITITNPANGSFSAASLTNSKFVSIGGGQYKYTGTQSYVTSALSKLQFVPTTGLSGSVTTTFNFSLSDGIAITLGSTDVTVNY